MKNDLPKFRGIWKSAFEDVAHITNTHSPFIFILFEFKRLQFPIKASFAMSINKAQGQSLKVVGLNLAEPVFSHGQLYVACSRAQDSKQLYMYAPNGRTKNVVYQEALQH